MARSNRDTAKVAIRDHANRVEEKAAQLGCKAIALHAYHAMQDKLTRIGHAIHKEDWKEVTRLMDGPMFTDCDLELNALKWAVKRARELGLGGNHAS